MSYWKPSFGRTQISSNDDPSPAINALGTRTDGAWTLMDSGTGGPSPPTYPDVSPQPGPIRTSAHSSTNGVTGYQTVSHFYLPRSRSDTHMPFVEFGCPRSRHRVSFPLRFFARFPPCLRLCVVNRPPRPSSICDNPPIRLTRQRHGCDGQRQIFRTFYPLVTASFWPGVRLPRKLITRLPPPGPAIIYTVYQSR